MACDDPLSKVCCHGGKTLICATAPDQSESEYVHFSIGTGRDRSEGFQPLDGDCTTIDIQSSRSISSGSLCLEQGHCKGPAIGSRSIGDVHGEVGRKIGAGPVEDTTCGKIQCGSIAGLCDIIDHFHDLCHFESAVDFGSSVSRGRTNVDVRG